MCIREMRISIFFLVGVVVLGYNIFLRPIPWGGSTPFVVCSPQGTGLVISIMVTTNTDDEHLLL